MWIEENDVVLDDALGEEDGVFEVVAVPRHEGDEHIAPERKLASSVDGPSAMMSPFLHLVAHFHQRTLIDAGILVGALEFLAADRCRPRLGRIWSSQSRVRQCGWNRPDPRCRCGGPDRSAGIARNHPFHPGSDKRRLGAQTAEPPGAACWSPSRRGWRHHFPGTG